MSRAAERVARLRRKLDELDEHIVVKILGGETIYYGPKPPAKPRVRAKTGSGRARTKKATRKTPRDLDAS